MNTIITCSEIASAAPESELQPEPQGLQPDYRTILQQLQLLHGSSDLMLNQHETDSAFLSNN